MSATIQQIRIASAKAKFHNQCWRIQGITLWVLSLLLILPCYYTKNYGLAAACIAFNATAKLAMLTRLFYVENDYTKSTAKMAVFCIILMLIFWVIIKNLPR